MNILPDIPITKMKYRKFEQGIDSGYPVDKEHYYLFKRGKFKNGKGYEIVLCDDFTKVKEFRYFYCGKVLNPKTGELLSLFKERKIKGHLGYIDMDVKFVDSDTGIYHGFELEGFILIYKEKYLLFDGRYDTYFIDKDSIDKHYVKRRNNVTSYGKVIRPTSDNFESTYEIKEME